jgi:hypothetical protein
VLVANIAYPGVGFYVVSPAAWHNQLPAVHGQGTTLAFERDFHGISADCLTLRGRNVFQAVQQPLRAGTPGGCARFDNAEVFVDVRVRHLQCL